MKLFNKKRQEGFTIIEVLIVLAIAGLIMLIVFLAVPALQRNSRNTQRRNDVAIYLAAINEWSTNNSGSIPSADAHLTTAGSGVNAISRAAFLNEPIVVVTGVQTTAVSINDMQYVGQAACSTATTGNTIAGAARQFAVRFAVENSAGTAVPQCTDS